MSIGGTWCVQTWT